MTCLPPEAIAAYAEISMKSRHRESEALQPLRLRPLAAAAARWIRDGFRASELLRGGVGLPESEPGYRTPPARAYDRS